jgi:hypothetical protein
LLQVFKGGVEVEAGGVVLTEMLVEDVRKFFSLSFF